MNQVVEQQQRKPALVSGGSIAAIVPQSIEEAFRLSEAIHMSGMAPYGFDSPQKVMIAMLAGLELGLPPMSAVQSVAVINNRPCIWGDALIGVVRKSPLCLYVTEWIDGEGDDMVAHCETHRKGEPKPVKMSFSVTDAKKAGLWQTEAKVTKSSKNGGTYQKDNDSPWYKYPKRMLQMRARAWCLRDVYADVTKGMQVREEVEDYQHTGPDNAKDITPTQPSVMQRLQAQKASQESQERQEGFDRSFVHSESDFASAPLSGDIIDQDSASAPHETETGASPVPPDAPEAGELAPNQSPASTIEDPTGGPTSGDAAGANDLSPEAPVAVETENQILIRFARDVLPMAGDPETTGAALSAIEKEWANEIKKLSAGGQAKATSISKSMRAIFNGSASLDAALSFHAEGLGCDVTDLGGKIDE